MSEFTSGTFSTGDLSAHYRRGDAVRLTSDLHGMGTKVVVRVHPAGLDVRDVRWYDRVRWFLQRTRRRVRTFVVRLFAKATP